MTPLLLRFADSIPSQPVVRLLYDETRQVSLVRSGDVWVEALTQPLDMTQTRQTRVESETTDDN